MNENLEVKASLSVTDAGEIVANAWPFGTPDSSGDLIIKGAFNFILTETPMLFGHNPDDLIGTWNEIAETSDALVAKGKMHMEQPRARAVHGLIKGGLVSGVSIGFKTKASTQQGRNRVISALDIYEISVVKNPMHPRARIVSAKEFDSASAIAAALNRAAAHFQPKR